MHHNPWLFAAFGVGLLAVGSCVSDDDRPTSTTELRGPFEDHDGELPPPSAYDGSLFELSQDYPETLPERGNQPWLDVDPKQDPDGYQLAIRDYFFEGMFEAGFRPQYNQVRHWYHVPWMHVGRNPREAIRGLTNERASRCGDLGPQQTRRHQNWGVGLFNPIGAYTVGRVWADPQNPDPTKSQFLEGTVVVKLLFSAAPDGEVPGLEGAPAWTAYIRRPFTDCRHSNQPRQVRQVRLLQMDIAVKDRRAGVTGWFFGSLVYEKSVGGVDAWRKLSPGGLQWGPDHGYGLADRNADKPLVETYLSDPQPVLSTHKGDLGWLGRLNGPIDNPRSSCMSCHSTAQWPNSEPLVPPRNLTESQRMRWFRRLAGDEPFSPNAEALDYSLQIQLSIRNFTDHTNTRGPSEREALTPVEAGYEIAR